ncbi:hypothetical protein JW926_11985 [Candidatus Sumerlaeota bacterium]|nr:hypothetical protein [Candidatus Sumerlaeota bacterium]
MRKSIILILIITLTGLCMELYGARYYVKPGGSGNQTGSDWENALGTLTKASTLAKSGDEVWVAEGTYMEGAEIKIGSNVSFYGGFNGTEVELEQRNWKANPTIIDGNNAHQCVINYGICNGFNITRGNTLEGGGIENICIIMNCAIHNNEAEYSGGGVYNNNGIMDGCIIFNNIARLGGGIRNYAGTMTNCIVYGNEAKNNGGGVFNERGSFNNSVIYNNQSLNTGGIYNMDGNITHCTVYGNKSTNRTGGILHYGGTVTNSISWKNTGGDILDYSLGVKYCCFGNALNEDGNFPANPLFENTAGDISTWDFHLKDGSPCIDAGTLNATPFPDTDLDGNLRPGGDGMVCLGAYESPNEYIPGEPEPSKRLYVKPDGNDDADGMSWGTAFKTLKKTISQSLQFDSLYEIWVAKGTYMEGEMINIPSYVYLYGGFAGTEIIREQRDWENNPTVIDGSTSYGCVINFGSIDGFNVTNGNSDQEGVVSIIGEAWYRIA